MRVFCGLSFQIHCESDLCEFSFIMSRSDDLSNHLARLDIEEEENESFNINEEAMEAGNKYELCVAGRFLTELSVNSRAMKTKLADVWQPTMGINIKEIE